MEFKTVFTSVRPARVAVFIDSSDVDWQDSALRIIEFLATLWGGRHSLIVPTDGAGIAPEFWATLESFDPDYLFYYQKTVADMKIAKPKEYEAYLQREIERHQAQHGTSDPVSTRKMADEQLPKARVSNFALSPALRDELARRLVPFSLHDGNIGPIEAETNAFWPLTGISSLLPCCEHPGLVASVETNVTMLPPIWYAASLGSIHAPHLAALAGSGVRPLTVRFESDHLSALFDLVITGRDRLWNLAPSEYPSTGRRFPFELTMAELSTYQSIDAAYEFGPFTVIVGDSLPDFCLYYNLRRLGRASAWLPWSWLETSKLGLARFQAGGESLRDEERLAGLFARGLYDMTMLQIFERIRYLSTSQPLDQIELAIQHLQVPSMITQAPIRSTAEPIRPEDLAIGSPPQPRNSRNAWRPVEIPVESGRSLSSLETPTPLGFSSVDPGQHRWIAEISVRSHEYPQHPALGPWLLRIEGYSDKVIRTTKSGLAYLCPNTIIMHGQDINLVVVRPHIHIPDAFGVVSFLLERKAQTCRISDKGYYAKHSIQKFGGLERLAGVFRDARKGAVLRKFLDHSKRQPGTTDEGVYLNSDRRVYLDLPAVTKIVGDEREAVTLLDDFTIPEIVQRGFIFRCGFCRNADWYPLKDVSQTFECRRCERSQVFTQRHWKDPAQPNLYYKLDEIIYQGISNDMAVPILALDHFRKRAKRAFDFSPELEILRTAGNKPALEVDVCCLMDGSLIVGEAKTAPILAKVRKEERIMIANYRELAADIGASTVVFATIAPSWDTITRQEIDKAFSGDRIKPFILSGSDLN